MPSFTFLESYSSATRKHKNSSSTATLAAGDIVESAGRYGVVLSAIGPGKTGDVDCGQHLIEVPPNSSAQTGAVGDQVRWDSTNSKLAATSVSTGSVLGRLATALAASDSVARVILNW